MHIPSLAGAIGVAIIGDYAHPPRAGHVRHNAFMAHLVEGRMRDTLKTLLRDLELAKRKGLVVRRTTFRYRDEDTPRHDRRMIWSSRMVIEERRLRERLVLMVAEGLGKAPDLQPYHVLGDKVMSVGGWGMGRAASVVDV